MKSSDFDLREEAFSTRSNILDTVDSPNSLVVFTLMGLVRLMHPEITSSPTDTFLGRLSPVSAAVSRVLVPSSMTPSIGIFSPGRT